MIEIDRLLINVMVISGSAVESAVEVGLVRVVEEKEVKQFWGVSDEAVSTRGVA